MSSEFRHYTREEFLGDLAASYNDIGSVHPRAILVMLPGSLPRGDCQPQKEIRSGVIAKINIGFTAWNQVVGISNPKTCQSALRSAKI